MWIVLTEGMFYLHCWSMYSLQGMCDLFLLFFACCRVTVRDGEKMEIGTIFEHSVILARLDACSTDLYGLSNLNSIML